MGLYSGMNLTDTDVDRETQQRIKQIVRRLMNGEIDPPDGERQLIDLIVRASNRKTRTLGREGEEDAKL